LVQAAISQVRVMLDLPSAAVRAIGMAVALGLSAFFSGSETALFSLPPDRAEVLRRLKAGSGRAAARLLRSPRRLLTTILFGNMLVNVAFYSISVPFTVELSRSYGTSAGLLFALLTLIVVIVFGEVLPKSIAVVYPFRFSLVVAIPLSFFNLVLSPFTRVLNKIADATHTIVERVSSPAQTVTSEEMKTLLEMSREARALDPHAGQMIAEVLDLSEIKVKEIMIPRVDMRGVDLGTPAAAVMEMMKAAALLYMPVYLGRVDRVQGVVRLQDIYFNPDTPIARLVRKIPFVPEVADVEDALKQLREANTEYAFVVDEFGALAGLITMELLVEEIVGEISSEFERPEEPLVQVGDNEYLISGNLGIRDWQELFGLDLPDLPVATLGGVIAARLGRIPEVGDRVQLLNVELEVVEARRFRVQKVRLRILDSEQGDSPGGCDEKAP